jgi:hypothetical protein
VAELKAPKAPQCDGLARLQGGHNRLQARRKHRVGLGLREVDRRGHLVDERGLGHSHLLCGRGGIVAGLAGIEQSHSESVPGLLIGVKVFARLCAA